MKSTLFLIAPFALFSTVCTFSCEPLTLAARYFSNFAPGQFDVTQYSGVYMLGRCDTPYSKFHADLTLYSVTQEHYCQLYHADAILSNLAPQDGTLLQGSQHAFESTAGNFLGLNNDIYNWRDQNFPVDIHAIVMPCATYYYIDNAGTQSPPATACDITFAYC